MREVERPDESYGTSASRTREPVDLRVDAPVQAYEQAGDAVETYERAGDALAADREGTLRPGALLYLQGAAGNQAVSRMLAGTRARSPAAPPGEAPAYSEAPPADQATFRQPAPTSEQPTLEQPAPAYRAQEAPPRTGSAAFPAGSAVTRGAGGPASAGVGPVSRGGGPVSRAHGALAPRGGGSAPRARGAAVPHGGGPAPRGGGPAPRPGGGTALGGAGAAAPAGPDPLAAWQASVTAAAQGIAEPDLSGPAAAAGALGQQAGELDARRRAAQPDYGADARARVGAPPAEPPREQTLDTTVPEGAVGAVRQAGQARLPDQTFSPMRPMPAFGGDGGGGGRPASPLPAAQQPQSGGGGPAVSGGPVAADPSADEVRGRVAGVTPTTAGEGPAGPVTLHDRGPASLKPPPAGQAREIGEVLARAKANVGRYADEFVRAGSTQLDPSGKNAGLAPLVAALKPEQEQSIAAEIDRVAAAAGVSADQLAARVAGYQAQTEQGAQQAANDLAIADSTATSRVQARGAAQLGAVEGARQAIVADIARQQEAASGSPDPSVISSRRDGYLNAVESAVASGTGAYRVAGETRTADLDRVAGERKQAYRQQARTAATRIRGQYPDDESKGRVESRPALDWAEQQCLAVDAELARLKRAASADAARLTETLNAAGAQSREQIRDWAAAQTGRQRSWWEKLLDRFKDWATQSKADVDAWQAQRAAETRDSIAGDFDMLVRLREQLAAGNREAVAAEVSRLTAEQRAVVNAFLRSGGQDAIGAVATGVIERLKGQRVPQIAKTLEEQAIAQLDAYQLNDLCRARNGGFDARILVRDIRSSVSGLGTNEQKLFRALQGHSPMEVAAIRKMYAAVYSTEDEKVSLDEDLFGGDGALGALGLSGELSGSEAERARALLSGDTVAGAVATLNDAMSGAGTDEDTIMQTLRGLSPADREAVVLAYQERYHVDLTERLKGDMDEAGTDFRQAEALLRGDTSAADAYALSGAMEGLGTDEATIHAVYARIRDEVESQAQAKGMTTAEVEAEIRRRTQGISQAYAAQAGADQPATLEAAYADELSGGELNLALGEQAYDQTAMDAAKIQMEHESVCTSDDTVNAVLRNQYDRASRDTLRDLQVRFNEDPANQGLSAYERSQRWERLQKDPETQRMIDERARRNMTALEARYDADNPEWGPGGFQSVIELEMSGYSYEEARALIRQGGHLSDAQELKYAIFGEGTNEDAIRKALRGKSRAEIEALRQQYRELTGNDLMADLEGDLTGRDLADTRFLMNGTRTPDEMAEYLRARSDWETNEGTGFFSEMWDNEEERVLLATTDQAQSAYLEYVRMRDEYGEDDPRTRAARERFEGWTGVADKDVEQHREAVDSITDTAATVAAVAAGVIVTVLSGGAAAPAVAAAAAYFGTSTVVVAGVAAAVAATAASMATRWAGKGDAYGGEDVAVDLAQGLVEGLAAAATAGMSEAAMQALMRSPAMSMMREGAESGLLRRVAAATLASGLEGAAGGLPSGVAGAILNERTWQSDDPFGAILRAGGTGALTGFAVGGAMGGGAEALKGLRGAAGHGAGEPGMAGEAGEGTGAHGEPGTEVGAEAGLPEPRPVGGEPVETSPVETGPVETAPVETGPVETGPVETGGSAEPHPIETGPVETKPVETGPVETGPVETGGPGRLGLDSDPIVIDKLPDETVMMPPNPRNGADAELMYHNSFAEDPLREVAIYRNAQSGEYIVIQGNEYTVQVAPGEAPQRGGVAQRWKEILDGYDVGTWELQGHYHPNQPGAEFTHPVNQWPSGANGDLRVVWGEALESGAARSSRINYRTPEGPGYTDFGFDPARERPFWVDLPDGKGGRTVRDFANIEEYHAFMADEMHAPQGSIPPEMLSTPKPEPGAPEPGAPEPGAPGHGTPEPEPATPGASTAQATPASQAVPAQVDVINQMPIEDNAVKVTLEGVVGDPIPDTRPLTSSGKKPKGRPAGMEAYYESGGEVGLPDYRRAHMWGPGFGADIADGIMLAHTDVNSLQNTTVEGRIRALHQKMKAQGGQVLLKIEGTSHPRVPGEPQYLQSVRYEIRVRYADGRVVHVGDVWIGPIGLPGTPTSMSPAFGVDAGEGYSLLTDLD